jgi:hypothetical protein
LFDRQAKCCELAPRWTQVFPKTRYHGVLAPSCPKSACSSASKEASPREVEEIGRVEITLNRDDGITIGRDARVENPHFGRENDDQQPDSGLTPGPRMQLRHRTVDLIVRPARKTSEIHQGQPPPEEHRVNAKRSFRTLHHVTARRTQRRRSAGHDEIFALGVPQTVSDGGYI